MFLLVSCSLAFQDKTTKELENKNVKMKLASFITSLTLCCWTRQWLYCWGGSRGGSGGSVEPPKVKQTLIF